MFVCVCVCACESPAPLSIAHPQRREEKETEARKTLDWRTLRTWCAVSVARPTKREIGGEREKREEREEKGETDQSVCNC